jgi:flavin reductase (DIM6/NTAB) family NADH-FMN oxidoreductase RutF
VLAADAEATARRFAQAATQDVAADEGDVFAGAPVLRQGLAHLACRTHHRAQAGDHLIITGAVLDMRVSAGAALTFYRGEYGSIAGPARRARSKE